MLFGLCSLKSSPGVTTTALTLAGAWPTSEARPTVMELDARGGDVAWRFGLASDPGLRSLAAAARLRPAPGLVAAHAQPVGGAEVPVVVAPLERDAARQAAGALTGLLDVLRDADESVLLDLGEVEPKDPDTADLLQDLAVLLVVARAVPEQIARIQSAMGDLRRIGRRVKALLIGDVGQYEAAAILQMPVAGVLPLIDADAGPVGRLVGHRARRAFEAEAARIAGGLAADAELSNLVREAADTFSEAAR